jgi:hypothetical protein
MRGLRGGEDPPADSRRELNKCEEICGIEIVLSRLVNHTELPMFLGLSIRNDFLRRSKEAS